MRYHCATIVHGVNCVYRREQFCMLSAYFFSIFFLTLQIILLVTFCWTCSLLSSSFTRICTIELCSAARICMRAMILLFWLMRQQSVRITVFFSNQILGSRSVSQDAVNWMTFVLCGPAVVRKLFFSLCTACEAGNHLLCCLCEHRSLEVSGLVLFFPVSLCTFVLHCRYSVYLFLFNSIFLPVWRYLDWDSKSYCTEVICNFRSCAERSAWHILSWEWNSQW